MAAWSPADQPNDALIRRRPPSCFLRLRCAEEQKGRRHCRGMGHPRTRAVSKNFLQAGEHGAILLPARSIMAERVIDRRQSGSRRTSGRRTPMSRPDPAEPGVPCRLPDLSLSQNHGTNIPILQAHLPLNPPASPSAPSPSCIVFARCESRPTSPSTRTMSPTLPRHLRLLL